MRYKTRVFHDSFLRDTKRVLARIYCLRSDSSFEQNFTYIGSKISAFGLCFSRLYTDQLFTDGAGKKIHDRIDCTWIQNIRNSHRTPIYNLAKRFDLCSNSAA